MEFWFWRFAYLDFSMFFVTRFPAVTGECRVCASLVCAGGALVACADDVICTTSIQTAASPQRFEEDQETQTFRHKLSAANISRDEVHTQL
jgi:hypothetical protein